MKNVGDGTRILNFLIDGFLVFLLSYAAFKYWNFYVVYWHFKTINFWWFVAGVLFVYYSFFEMIWARTPGKWFSGSKVVDIQGNHPSPLQVIGRSILRLIVIDFFFNAFWGKPLHDKLTRTEVIEA
ncbi:MAG: RDD family protein [Bacteroidetes bacterium]|nr:RDD family protein [Bacteroidota bacterium]